MWEYETINSSTGGEKGKLIQGREVSFVDLMICPSYVW